MISGVRTQLCHIIDLAPTVLDVCGVTAPDVVDGVTQLPIDGASLRPTFTDAGVPEHRTTQYFEMLGSRSIVHDGWKATTDHVSQGVLDEQLLEGSRALADDRWNLFRLDDDFAEARDLADEHPDVVAALAARWDEEAARHGVLPICDNLHERLSVMEPPLWPTPRHVRYRPGGGAVADEAAPSLGGGSLVTASVEVPAEGAEGVLCAIGDWTNGWALVVLDGRPTFLLNIVSRGYQVQAPAALTPGPHDVGLRFEADGTGAGEGVLYVDGHEVARGSLPEGVGMSGIQIGGGGLRIGEDAGFPVSDDYRPPFRFTGTLHHVEVDGRPPSAREQGATLQEALRRE